MGLPTLIATTMQSAQCFEDEPDCHSDYELPPYPERLETYIVPFIFSIIFVVGVVGNGTLIMIFLKHRSMRNIPNT